MPSDEVGKTFQRKFVNGATFLFLYIYIQISPQGTTAVTSCRQERGRTGQDWVQVCAGSRHLQASHLYAGHMVLHRNLWPGAAGPPGHPQRHTGRTTSPPPCGPGACPFVAAQPPSCGARKWYLRAVLPLGGFFLLLFCGRTSLPAPVPLVASGHIVFQKTFKTFTVCFGC